MVETLIAKVGRKTFQGIANRQRRAAERRMATLTRRPNFWRRHGNEYDYLHIFFHPDYDRRLWLLTRSADPASSFMRQRLLLRERSRAHRLALSRRRHTAGGEFRPALKTH
jgi:hypothetical protein